MRRPRRRGSVVPQVGILLLPWTVWVWACAASGPPKATAPPAPDPIVVQLTQLLKLDAAQQGRTQRLVEELYERNAKIRENWDRGARVRPEELLGSRGIFERDFQAILTEDQKRVYGAERLKLQLKSSRLNGS